MLCPAPKRVAALAVSRYRLDEGQVQSICRQLAEAGDLLQALLDHGLLTPEQAADLRSALEETDGQFPARTTLPEVTESDIVVDAKAPEALGFLGGFCILRRLGEGSMGTVYLGYHARQERQVAIKVLGDALALYPTCVERFYRESKNSILLVHPNLVRGYSAGYDEAAGKHYLVREYVDGLSAQALLDRLGRLPVGAAMHIALDVAQALAYLQGRDLVHRDVKPDNILLATSGVAKLADLGLLKRIGEGYPWAQKGQGFGTSYYMAPEQAEDANRVDGRTDIYALGATLYHLLTGEVPFPGSSHQEIVQKKNRGYFQPASSLNPLVPREIDTILCRLLAPDPRDRYPIAADLVQDLLRTRLAVEPTQFPEIRQSLQGLPPPATEDEPGRRTRPDVELMHTTLRPAGAQRSWVLLGNLGLALAFGVLLGMAIFGFCRNF